MALAAATLAMLTMTLSCDPYDYPGYAGELEVRWNVDGSRAKSLCSTYGIDTWVVSVSGPSTGSVEVNCNEGWGALIYGLNPGRHDVTVRAVDFGGRTLATRSVAARIATFDYDLIEVDFAAKDFDGSGGETADLEVSWNVDGKTGVSTCTTFGIARWAIKVEGAESKTFDVTCGDAWNSKEQLYGLKPGNYTVSVEAYDQQSGGTVLAQRSKTVKLAYDPTTIWTVDHTFAAADFTKIVPKGKLSLSWTINGTIDGTVKGPSWDKCDEVGATKVEVSVDGQKSTHSCNVNAVMGTSIGDIAVGSRDVTVTLLDDQDKALTSAATAKVDIKSNSDAELVVDFPFDSFVQTVRDAIKGDFIFRTLFEGKSCADAGAGRQLVLLKADGTPVAGQVCDSTKQSCAPTDGASFLDCQPSFTNQLLTDLPWGIYKLKVSGAKSGATDICWQTKDSAGGDEIAILIGAGTSNPVVTLDLQRISTTGGCQ